MIIRRKHTANFTTIGNSLFNDERLEADEVGILAYLLSRPHDWEVRRPALQRRWRVGRDSIKRVVHSLMRTGWLIAVRTRLSNGTFHIVYEVRDEPGPELSVQEIRDALSLVSSDAGSDDVTDDDDTAPSPPTENPSASAGQPCQAHPSTADPSAPIRTLQNTDLQRKDSTKATRDYVDLKNNWPAENILSDVAAQSAFLTLTDTAKNDACEGQNRYLEDCHANTRKVCDLTTYLRERRWERFTGKEKKPPLIVIKFGTPQYFRWRDYKIAHGQWSERNESAAKAYGGISVPSEWPPSQAIKEEIQECGRPI